MAFYREPRWSASIRSTPAPATIGIGPWTADYLAMRVGGDRDVLLASDLVVKRAAVDLGVDLAGGRPDWAPMRTYATYHLWAHLVADVWAAQR